MSQERVVITGATAGVGRATARTFARRGAQIGLLARGQDGLEATKEDVEGLGGEAIILPADVANADDVESAAETVVDKFGGIDVWINNAMTSVFSPIKNLTPAEYRRVTEVTYLGQVYGTMAALQHMLPRNQGSVVLVGSSLAYRGIPLQSAYCGAKHGVQGFLDSLRSELLHDGSDVQVTMVQLPALNTPQFNWVRNKMPLETQPVPPIYQPEIAADAILYAANHDEREIYVGYPSLQAIIGNKIAPGLLDRILASTGYSSQMRQEAKEKDRPDNLWEPVPGDAGAHGIFDDRARDWSLEWWLSKNTKLLTTAAAGVAGVVAGMMLD